MLTNPRTTRSTRAAATVAAAAASLTLTALGAPADALSSNQVGVIASNNPVPTWVGFDAATNHLLAGVSTPDIRVFDGSTRLPAGVLPRMSFNEDATTPVTTGDGWVYAGDDSATSLYKISVTNAAPTETWALPEYFGYFSLHASTGDMYYTRGGLGNTVRHVSLNADHTTTILDTWDTGLPNYAITALPDNSKLFARGGQSIFSMTPGNGAVRTIAGIPAMSSWAAQMPASPDSKDVYVVGSDGAYKIDTATDTVTGHLSLTLTGTPVAALSTDGTTLYAADGTGNIYAIDTATMAGLDTTTWAGQTFDSAIVTSDGTLYTADPSEHEFHVFDTAPTPSTNIHASALATDGQGGHAHVTWTAPSAAGGATESLTYTVTATDVTRPGNGGQTASASNGATAATVDGLTLGDDYTFTVRATNSVGHRDSAASASVTIPQQPAAPPTFAPHIVAHVTAAVPASASDWYRTPVTVSFTCSAGSSPVTTCPAPMTLSANGRNQTVKGTAVAADGESASAVVSGINIDTTAPTGFQLWGLRKNGHVLKHPKLHVHAVGGPSTIVSAHVRAHREGKHFGYLLTATTGAGVTSTDWIPAQPR